MTVPVLKMVTLTCSAKIVRLHVSAVWMLSDPSADMKNLRKRIKLLPKKLDNKLDTLKAKVLDELDVPKPDPNPKPSASASSSKPNFTSEETKGATTAIAMEGHPDLFRQDTRGSVKSKKSGKSHKSQKSKEDIKIQFDAPAEAETDDEDDEDDDDPNDRAFDHPSVYKAQQWIWVPKDALGLSVVLVDDMKAAGVDASDTGAQMDEKGIVEVTRNPPDEDWSGGHDR